MRVGISIRQHHQIDVRRTWEHLHSQLVCVLNSLLPPNFSLPEILCIVLYYCFGSDKIRRCTYTLLYTPAYVSLLLILTEFGSTHYYVLRLLVVVGIPPRWWWWCHARKLRYIVTWERRRLTMVGRCTRHKGRGFHTMTLRMENTRVGNINRKTWERRKAMMI